MIASKLEGQSCSPCDAGYRLKKICTPTEDTVCRLCPKDTFQKYPGFKRECQRCSTCRRKEIVKRKCTRVEDTVCECPKNHVHNKYKPCTACPKGQVVVNNRCTNKTEISTPAPITTNTTKLSQETQVAIIAGVVAALIIAIIGVCCFILKIRKKDKNRKDEVSHCITKDTPVTSDCVMSIKPPDIEGKSFPARKPNENVYCAIPTVEPRRLCSNLLPFSLVYDMECMLTSSHSKNYKHLAGELGYTLTFIKQLEVDPHPVETLLGDWITSKLPTKEQLYNALLKIKRPDVAAKVQEEL